MEVWRTTPLGYPELTRFPDALWWAWARTYQVHLVVTRCLNRVARATKQNQVCRSLGFVDGEGIEARGIGPVQAAGIVAALYGSQPNAAVESDRVECRI